jgi:hypothetical protein
LLREGVSRAVSLRCRTERKGLVIAQRCEAKRRLNAEIDHRLDWGCAMKTFTTTAVMLALLTVPAYSQGKGSAPDPKAEAEKIEQKKRAQEIERDYKASLKRTTPQSAAPSDPWRDLRPSASKPQQ